MHSIETNTEASPWWKSRRLLACLGVISLFTILRLYYAAKIPLLSAEAYYWTWGLQPAFGYYDHPPVLALLTRFSTALAGHSSLGVRLGSVILGLAGSIVFLIFYRKIASDRSVLRAIFFLSFAPFFFTFGVAATPDSPLIFFWILTLFLFWESYDRNTFTLWVLTGISTGLCILSKYNGFQLPLALFVFLILTRRGRKYLKGIRPYLALIIALAIIAPNILWNLKYGASTAKMPFQHGIRLDAPFEGIGIFLLLPFLALTPLMGVLWIRGSLAALKQKIIPENEGVLFACCTCWIPLACFALLSPAVRIHAQWIATCFVTAVPLIFYGYKTRRPEKRKRLEAAGLISGFILVSVILIVPVVALHSESAHYPGWLNRMLIPLTGEMLGWPQLGTRIEKEIQETERLGPVFLASKDYHVVSSIIWLTRNRVPGIPLATDSSHQFNVWGKDKDLLGWNAIFVAKDEHPVDLLRKCFQSYRLLPPVSVTLDGTEVRRFVLYFCEGFRGKVPRY